MKKIFTGILLLAMFTVSLTGCVSKETFEKVQQDLSTAEEVVSDQQAQIAELSSELGRANEALETEQGRSAELATGLEQTGAELEETQTTLANMEITLADTQAAREDIRVQLADAREQLGVISETPFGLYYIIDTPAGQQLVSPPDESSEILVDGYVLIKNYDDVMARYGTRDVTLGHWLLMGISAPGVEVDRDIMSGLITGPGVPSTGVSSKTVAIGYQEVLEKWGSTHAADHYGSIVWARIPCTWKPGLGWVSDDPVRVLKHPLIEYLVCDIFGHHVPAQFEILEKTPQVMTLALDPELIVKARGSAAEAGVDFEEWLTEAILAKIE